MTMRAQYALEAVLIAAVFFVLVSLFAGLYLELSKAERAAISKNTLRASLDVVASRADAAYFLGDGNEFLAELPPNSTLSYADGVLLLERDGVNVSRKVSAKMLVVEDSGNVRIANRNGTVVIEGA